MLTGEDGGTDNGVPLSTLDVIRLDPDGTAHLEKPEAVAFLHDEFRLVVRFLGLLGGRS